VTVGCGKERMVSEVINRCAPYDTTSNNDNATFLQKAGGHVVYRQAAGEC
jgi:hypothetical protein